MGGPSQFMKEMVGLPGVPPLVSGFPSELGLPTEGLTEGLSDMLKSGLPMISDAAPLPQSMGGVGVAVEAVGGEQLAGGGAYGGCDVGGGGGGPQDGSYELFLK